MNKIISKFIKSYYKLYEGINFSDLDDSSEDDDGLINTIHSTLLSNIRIGDILYYNYASDSYNVYGIGYPIAVCVITAGQLDKYPRFMAYDDIHSTGKSGIRYKYYNYGGTYDDMQKLTDLGLVPHRYMHTEINGETIHDIDGHNNTKILLSSNSEEPFYAAEACNKYTVLVRVDTKKSFKYVNATQGKWYLPAYTELLQAFKNLKYYDDSQWSNQSNFPKDNKLSKDIVKFGNWRRDDFLKTHHLSSTRGYKKSIGGGSNPKTTVLIMGQSSRYFIQDVSHTYNKATTQRVRPFINPFIK